ncbi:5'/3'-nucleotidase SurE [Pseudogemmobacter humi]|uniref:5'-nucleotidase n=1 Tax=Pseudogemmobacter humi TaxID=2483812 RepID=A0A3P5XRY3_9RHOB|nr:5'/3'-nucleotidase SurE [Pseudogemmobacter humi]VDC33640.1 5'-nucleotidase SurE [Pseudogemmobacter humi]
MRILVCNDDGIGAPGLVFLESVARLISGDVWVVAPEAKRTAGSGAITVARPLTITRHDERHFATSGTPADSVVVAMTWLFAGGQRPDLVLSGVNDGRNVAEDLTYSGTLGIAREASFWGIPAIGFSRVKEPVIGGEDAPWLAAFIREIWQDRADWLPEGHYLSVNLPERLPAPITEPRVGRDKIGSLAEEVSRDGARVEIIVPRGRPKTTSPGDENEAIDSGKVTVNRLCWCADVPLGPGLLSRLPQG